MHKGLWADGHCWWCMPVFKHLTDWDFWLERNLTLTFWSTPWGCNITTRRLFSFTADQMKYQHDGFTRPDVCVRRMEKARCHCCLLSVTSVFISVSSQWQSAETQLQPAEEFLHFEVQSAFNFNLECLCFCFKTCHDSQNVIMWGSDSQNENSSPGQLSYL